MRVMILVASLAAASSAPASLASPAAPHLLQGLGTPTASLPPKEECIRIGARHADAFGAQPRARRLDEMPPALLHHAVIREVDGCVVPAVVRRDGAR